jgi:hypothetical protein
MDGLGADRELHPLIDVSKASVDVDHSPLALGA